MKWLKRILLVLVVGIAGLMAIAIITDVEHQNYRRLTSQCQTDLDRLCREERAEGKMVTCLRERVAVVSETCKQAIADTIGE